MKKIAILFDLDGTLIDSTKAIVDSFAHAFVQNSYDAPSEDDVKNFVGNPLLKMFSSLGVKNADLEKVQKSYKEKYRILAPIHTHLLPNARDAIILASKNASLGVVTTKTSQYSHEILEHLGVRKFFKVIIGFDDVQKPKPDPEPVLKALKAIGEYDEAWMIGDTHMDILAGKNAGINAYAVLGEYEAKESLQGHTKLIANDSLEAVKAIISTKR
ncbi:MAG: hydrolase [Deltaproteobacteria bacterium]|nr:MAG: hydrolase [Deltaproteobacteria bacterium]